MVRLNVPIEVGQRIMSKAKRAVNLSLNEELVAETRTLTDNLSSVVEHLLAEFVAQETAKREAQNLAFKRTIDSWNSFGEKHKSFADDHSTL